MKIDRIGIKGANDNDFVMLDSVFKLYPVWRTLDNPEAVTSYVEIAGMNGALDCTEEFGEVFYRMRTLEMNCVFVGDNWYPMYEEFTSKYHGQNVQIMFANDPMYYWTGRLEVSQYYAQDHTVVIAAKVFPYKFKRHKTIVTASVDGEKTIRLYNGRMTVDPEITISAAVTLAWGDYTKALSASSYPHTVTLAGFQLKEGYMDVTITGTATVTFEYREGAL